jgi:BirA family biotin operon repressor/biotin-[acetyl-CoA-carboxylase] ligase
MINRFHFKEISSTNDYAKELIKDNEFVAVSADYQLNGRGRNSKSWIGNYAENIYLSLGINHKIKDSFKSPAIYQALGCLVVYNSLEKFIPDEFIRIKYPNDIYVLEETYKKISGILIEHSSSGKKADYTIIGIGLNVKQRIFDTELKENVTSLYKIGIMPPLEIVYQELISNFEELILLDENKIFNMWYEKLNMTNKDISVLGNENKWVFQSINNDCSLNLINLKSELKRIDNGDTIRYEL